MTTPPNAKRTFWLMEETFPIPGYPKYRITRSGEVYSDYFSPPRKLTRFYLLGYPRVNVRKCARQSNSRSVHILLALTFLGPRPSPKHEVRHIDGKPGNCSISNLAWATHKENIADKILHGTSNIGERNGSAKLTVEQVRWIRSQKGISTSEELGRKFGVNWATINKIWKRETWASF